MSRSSTDNAAFIRGAQINQLDGASAQQDVRVVAVNDAKVRAWAGAGVVAVIANIVSGGVHLGVIHNDDLRWRWCRLVHPPLARVEHRDGAEGAAERD